jgi:putative redox protein
MTTKKFEFIGSSGQRLFARLEVPEEPPSTYALFAHCFTCSKDLKAVVRISRHLAAAGIAVFRFDFTGLGESEGDFPDTNFSTNLQDLLAAAEFVADTMGPPRLLIGHSLGGSAVLSVANRIPGVEAIVTIAAASDTSHLSHNLIRMAPELEHHGEATVVLGGRSFQIRSQLVGDLESHRMEEAIGSLAKPLLVMHSPQDEIVEIEHGLRIFDLANDPKSFVALDGADHLLIHNESDSVYVADMLSTWAKHNIDL